jgi:hypothetical protein
MSLGLTSPNFNLNAVVTGVFSLFETSNWHYYRTDEAIVAEIIADLTGPDAVEIYHAITDA